MKVRIFSDKNSMGAAAAACGASYIRAALEARGYANMIFATAASQFEVQESLLKEPGIDWSKIRVFHLDEYIGLPADHPASFRKNLVDRFINKLPSPPAAFFPVDANADDLDAVIDKLGEDMQKYPIDIAFIGIGENGHISFNDPPANF